MAALQFDRGRPFPSQLLAFPRESPDVTAVERDAAKLGLPRAAVAGRPSVINRPSAKACVARAVGRVQEGGWAAWRVLGRLGMEAVLEKRQRKKRCLCSYAERAV